MCDVKKFEFADIVHRDRGVRPGDGREQRVIGRHYGGCCELSLRIAELQEKLRTRERVVVRAREPVLSSKRSIRQRA